MLSVLVLFHNSRDRAHNLLRSMVRAFQAWSLSDLEFIFIDDASDPQQQMPQLLADFRKQLAAGVNVVEMHFKEHQHYTRAMGYGLSAAKGRHVLFVSHDMLLNVDYVRTMLAVAGLDSRIGLVRGVSPYVDAHPQHTVTPPFPLRSLDDLCDFARYVSSYWGLMYTEDRLLTGDSMLIRREVIDKIGVFDPRYVGYFGDIDFGLRLQRAGFKMVCAKGAWLWHEGAAAYHDKAQRTGQDPAEVHRARMKVVGEAYRAFRDKWDKNLPPEYIGTDPLPIEALRAGPAPAGGEYQPSMTPDPAICTIR